jgi:hypothetical protein
MAKKHTKPRKPLSKAALREIERFADKYGRHLDRALHAYAVEMGYIPKKTERSRTMTKKASKPAKPKRRNPGPAPDVLKIEGNWKDAVTHALQVKKPPGGWPKPEPRRGRKKTA